MNQAAESLGEAKALLENNGETGFVMNSLYYAFYYPVIALVCEGKVPTEMQSVVIGLFDRQFISNGIFPAEFSEAIHRVFDLKPKCSGDRANVSQEEFIGLAKTAQDFISAVNLYLQFKAAP